MQKKLINFSILLALSFTNVSSFALQLTPDRNLTLEQVEQVARKNETVNINDQAWKNIEQGYNVILEAALNNIPVYGLTVGVGWNKDKPIFIEKNGTKVVSDELLAVSKKFNKSSLRAHSAGLGDALPIETVRAGMLIRLNTMLNGETGVQREVAEKYLEFLNHGITPVVPSRGTVGEADITLASHIGVSYDRRMGCILSR
ncbi:aromatic amino acid lyase [Mannheimia granulomatis]|uniref:aromatic amino acid lyase n=1 Tax=Mannheimia granulomatis TaxID=85402 RepID=UPI0004B101EF|nr:aromatic amino acid lyase [Mannheimia granulomatis]